MTTMIITKNSIETLAKNHELNAKDIDSLIAKIDKGLSVQFVGASFLYHGDDIYQVS